LTIKQNHGIIFSQESSSRVGEHYIFSRARSHVWAPFTFHYA